MNSIASEAHFRQRVVKYSNKNGVTAASIRFKRSRQAIYEWRAKYDGISWRSLLEKSHKPHSHPNQHTAAEKKMILSHWRRNKNDRIALWNTVRKKGYKRQYNSMNRALRKWIAQEEKKQKKKCKPKPYQRAEYPGQKIQIDVKYVPNYCVTNGNKYYQYTAIDECSRIVFREMYDEHSTYSSKDFLMKLIESFPFPIREVQTDNGTEWTTALLIKNPKNKTLFENALKEMDIIYHRIRIATPRHNGKVERQHRLDEERFYRYLRMYSLEDGRKQLKKYNKRSNDIPKVCLNFLSPNEVLAKYLSLM